jgi:RNA polymerase sigma-70 factor (ECF subfamily)
VSEKSEQHPEALCLDCSASIEELYLGQYKPLVRYVRTQFRSAPDQAEEIAQHAFENIAARGNLGTIGNLKAFLWRTVRNLAISDLRGSRVAARHQAEVARVQGGEEGYALTPERVLEAREQMDIVQSVLRAMPEQRRRAFILTRVEGLSHGDAARRLGISRPAVSKHVARAMDDLYAALHT